MCGIAGVMRFKGGFPGLSLVKHMTQALQHRGPDAGGYFDEGPISLGHRRLSIIDLSTAANQPMSDHSNRYHIVFNGEIYNFGEIKALIPEYPYQTHTDTEAILAAYEKWGVGCLRYMAGMFAFAIWDAQQQELFIARDRLGVKPLYYYRSEEGLLFASEIRALLASGILNKNLNLEAVSEFLQYQSVGQPHTIVKGIQSLSAGCYMLVTKYRQETVKYWDITSKRQDFEFKDLRKVRREIYRLLLQSVERRMVSDVPLGAFLSGGIDSSAVVGLMARVSAEPINTFTVGFDEKEYDESEYAKLVVQKFNTKHHYLNLEPITFIDQLLPALNAMDTPSGDGVNSYVVSKAIRETGVKVALSGVGGDELFAGYPIFRQYLKLMKWEKAWKISSPFRSLASALLIKKGSTRIDRYRQILKSPDLTIDNIYPVFRQILSPRMLADCTNLPIAESPFLAREILESRQTKVAEFPLLSQVSIAEYLGYTRNTLLTDMDQMSMAVSLEVREPFFDHDLIEFVLNVPDVQKFPEYPKRLLVESLNGLLPAEVVHRKKQGFVLPWNIWMKKELLSFCDQYIQLICQREFIKKDLLLVYWRRFLQNDASVRWMEIWLFVILEYWLQKNEVK